MYSILIAIFIVVCLFVFPTKAAEAQWGMLDPLNPFSPVNVYPDDENDESAGMENYNPTATIIFSYVFFSFCFICATGIAVYGYLERRKEEL